MCREVAEDGEWTAEHGGHHGEHLLHPAREDLRGPRGGQRHRARLPGPGQPRPLARRAPHPRPQARVAGGERAHHAVRRQGHLQVRGAARRVEPAQDGAQGPRAPVHAHRRDPVPGGGALAGRPVVLQQRGERVRGEPRARHPRLPRGHHPPPLPHPRHGRLLEHAHAPECNQRCVCRREGVR